MSRHQERPAQSEQEHWVMAQQIQHGGSELAMKHFQEREEAKKNAENEKDHEGQAA